MHCHAGVHLVLFFICFYILFTRRNPTQLIILSSITVMFALATADLVVSYLFILRDVPAVLRFERNVEDVITHINPKSPIFVTNKYVVA